MADQSLEVGLSYNFEVIVYVAHTLLPQWSPL